MSKKMSVFGVAMLIFLAVFGFGNIANNYASLGPSALIWFILLGLYFVPVSLMIAELTSGDSTSNAGLSGWIKSAMGERWAFIGAWCYFVANIFYIPTLISRIPVFFSWVIADYSYEDLQLIRKGEQVPGIITASNPEFFMILIVIVLIIVTMIAIYFEQIFNVLSKYTGIISLTVAGIFIVLGLAFVLLPGKSSITSITWENFKPSFAPTVWSTLAWLLFAIAGTETIGAYASEVKNPEKNIPKGIVLSAIIISLGYALGTLALAFVATPADLPSASLDQLTSLMYANLFQAYGIGEWALRAIMFLYFIVMIVASVLWSIANIRVFLSDAPKFLVPKIFRKTNASGTSIYGILFQSALVLLFVGIVTLGGDQLGNIYKTMFNMATMAVLVPFLIIFTAYILNRKRNRVLPYQMTKNNTSAIVIASLVLIVTTFATLAIGWEFGYLSDSTLLIQDSIEQAKLYFGGLAAFIGIGILWYEIARSTSKIKLK